MTHETIQGVLCGIKSFSRKRRSGPTNFTYHGLVGRYGIMPSIYVVFVFYACMCARAVKLSTISGKGGLNQMALPIIWCKCKKKEYRGV